MANLKQKFKPHVVHSRHSFKKLPKHHTSYSLLSFMLLMTAVFSGGWTAFASGAPNDSFTYTVNAKIPAEPLADAATIDKPDDQQRFSTQIITAEGYCPDASYVSLMRNGVYAGTTMCVDNRWSIELALVDGANLLQPQAYNRTDDAGPASEGITVSYDPPLPPEPEQPVTPTTPTTPTNVNQPGVRQPTKTSAAKPVPPLVLSGQFKYVGVLVGNQLIQTFTIAGGAAPYAISIDWGDGTNDLVSRATAGDFVVSHVYDDIGNQSQNSYIIKLTASDNQGNRSLLQTMAIVTAQDGAIGSLNNGLSGGILGGVQSDSAFGKFWRVAGPVYAVAFIALASFWLGERRELELLRRVPVRKHSHKHA